MIRYEASVRPLRGFLQGLGRKNRCDRCAECQARYTFGRAKPLFDRAHGWRRIQLKPAAPTVDFAVRTAKGERRRIRSFLRQVEELGVAVEDLPAASVRALSEAERFLGKYLAVLAHETPSAEQLEGVIEALGGIDRVVKRSMAEILKSLGWRPDNAAAEANSVGDSGRSRGGDGGSAGESRQAKVWLDARRAARKDVPEVGREPGADPGSPDGPESDRDTDPATDHGTRPHISHADRFDADRASGPKVDPVPAPEGGRGDGSKSDDEPELDRLTGAGKGRGSVPGKPHAKRGTIIQFPGPGTRRPKR